MITETMTDDAILALIQEALTFASPEQAANIKEWNTESSLSDMGISSIVALEMAGYIEEQLNVQFADDELAQIVNIEGLIALIRKQAH